jgi:hypothetical protein
MHAVRIYRLFALEWQWVPSMLLEIPFLVSFSHSVIESVESEGIQTRISQKMASPSVN